MIRGFDSNFIMDEKEEVIGIDLGSDACSEHEWGIKGIASRFGLKKDIKTFGIEKRRINNVPEHLIFKNLTIENKNYYVILYPCSIDINEKDYKRWLPSCLIPYNNFDLLCAWDEESFGILVSDKYEKEIKDLYDAFKRKDIAIGIAPSDAFKSGGLVFSIISKMSKEILDEIYEKDKDYYELQEAAKATGIYELLDKAGKGKFKGWFALKPEWKDENKKELIFWLNPYQQDIHNYGWFTLNDLKEWAENKGVIMKKHVSTLK